MMVDMMRETLGRVARFGMTLLGVLLGVFVLFHGVGGDPAEILAGEAATPEQVAAVRHTLGLDQPLTVQLQRFVGQALTLDWGRSWITGEPVAELLWSRVPATLTVMLPIWLLDAVLALPLALWVAAQRGRWVDRWVLVLTNVALSVSFLVYIIVGQYVLGYALGWFPVQGWSDSTWENLHTYAPLPVFLAVLVGLAPQTRLYRSFVLDELGQDYVRTARALGHSEAGVLWRHVLPNVRVPVVTHLGHALPGVFAGSFLIEVFFSIPGLGREVLTAVNRSDYPVLQAAALCLAAVTLAVNQLVDALYRRLDPRVRGAQALAGAQP